MPAVAASSVPAADLAAVRTGQQAAWSAGNYAVIGTKLQIVGEHLCEVLEKLGHTGPVTHPGPVNAAICGFLTAA